MLAVIGDIHGCIFTLKELYAKIKNDFPEAIICSVGDLVDRGKFSLDVVEFIKDKNIKFTPGNHDYMFYHFFEQPSSIFAINWHYNAHVTTLAAYEFEPEKVNEHVQFIKEQPLFLNLPDCFITHAGFSSVFRKALPPDFKDDLEMVNKLIYDNYFNEHGVLWNRDKLLDIGKLQVVGHTPSRNCKFDKKSNTIYIDTGAFSGNKLSCAIIENNKLITTISVDTNHKDLY